MAPLETPLLSANHLGELEVGGSASAPVARRVEVYEPSLHASTGAASRLQPGEGELSQQVHNVSLMVNILLFGSKLWVYIQSQSMVVLAALISRRRKREQSLAKQDSMALDAVHDTSDKEVGPAGAVTSDPLSAARYKANEAVAPSLMRDPRLSGA